jgi:hypothetical protein
LPHQERVSSIIISGVCVSDRDEVRTCDAYYAWWGVRQGGDAL